MLNLNIINFSNCVSQQLEKITKSTQLQTELGRQYDQAVDVIDMYSDNIPHHSPIPYSTSTAAMMLVASCIAPARN